VKGPTLAPVIVGWPAPPLLLPPFAFEFRFVIMFVYIDTKNHTRWEANLDKIKESR